jgi:uncharacterized cofD-like protein
MNKGIKICTIGGGSGMPIVNKALIKAGFKNIYPIVTTFDSGGDTGRMRTDERGQILAFSDYWRALISLWDDGNQKEVWEEMLRYRDGRGRNFGNIFFQFLAEKEVNLGEVDRFFSKLTGAKLKGKVIPVSLESSNLCFRTISKKEYRGENFIDEFRMSNDRIDKIWLDPKVKANPKAIDILKSVDVIILGPGTIYGSVLSNFLPKGIIEAFNKSRAKKIFLVNIFSPANETKSASQTEYIKIFERYLKTKSPFDLVLMADLSVLDRKILKKIINFYKLEHATLVRKIKNSDLKIKMADIAVVDKNNMRLRHSEKKLGEYFRNLKL